MLPDIVSIKEFIVPLVLVPVERVEEFASCRTVEDFSTILSTAKISTLTVERFYF